MFRFRCLPICCSSNRRRHCRELDDNDMYESNLPTKSDYLVRRKKGNEMLTKKSEIEVRKLVELKHQFSEINLPKEKISPEFSSDPDLNLLDLPSTSSSLESIDTNTGGSKMDFVFILVGLEHRMSPTSKTMLKILESSYIKNRLMIVKDSQQIAQLPANKNDRIFLFTTSSYVHEAIQISDSIEKFFVLGTPAEFNVVTKSFENIEDLIFQIAEEYAELCEQEANTYDRLGKNALAALKRKMIKEMYRQLMNISTGNKV